VVNENRNMILAIALSALVLIGWTALGEYLYPTPPAPKIAPGAAAPAGTAPIPGQAPTPAAAATAKPRAAIIGESPRITIDTPKLHGTIALKGAQLDDLVLKAHKTSIGKDAKPVELLSPNGTKHSYFSGFGWNATGMAVPDANTVWTASGQQLTPANPVTLSWDNGQGLRFQIKYSVDQDYMFTAEQSVTNSGTAAVAVQPFGYISRNFGSLGVASPLSPGVDVDSWTMHIGPIATLNDATNYDVDYSTLDEKGAQGENFSTTGGWVGFGDTYWLTAIVPTQTEKVEAGFRKSGNIYQADFRKAMTNIAPGATVTTKSSLFAGAKEVQVLDKYMDGGIQQFGNAIDWGWFKVIAKPIFYLLDWLFKFAGNFGVAIMLLTLTVKTLMFPIAQKQFSSMAQMKILQPKLKALQERHKDDRVKLQQEMMALYKKEKVSPASGCLPIFIQIPVFYALYKVLMLTIEMRHQPFVGWIKDLSAPDPAKILNLFGALDFDPTGFFGIGVLGVLLGITMWAQFKLSPQSPDPVQAQVFAIMPWVLMFIMAPFAAGLLLYWITNNVLTMAQQKWLYSRYPGMDAANTPAKPA
jgi:YidC/Oxa1 family membrane protein insertase